MEWVDFERNLDHILIIEHPHELKLGVKFKWSFQLAILKDSLADSLGQFCQ